MSYIKEFEKLCQQYAPSGDLPDTVAAQFILDHVTAILHDCKMMSVCPDCEMWKIIEKYYGEQAVDSIARVSPCISGWTCSETAEKPATVKLHMNDIINRIGYEIGHYARLGELHE